MSAGLVEVFADKTSRFLTNVIEACLVIMHEVFHPAPFGERVRFLVNYIGFRQSLGCRKLGRPNRITSSRCASCLIARLYDINRHSAAKAFSESMNHVEERVQIIGTCHQRIGNGIGVPFSLKPDDAAEGEPCFLHRAFGIGYRFLEQG